MSDSFSASRSAPFRLFTAMFLLMSHALAVDIPSSFSLASNPAGAWSYGYTETLGGPLILHVNHGTVYQIDYWQTDIGLGDPWVTHNATPVAIGPSSWVVEPGAMSLHPGPGGQQSVVRYTVAIAGDYVVEGAYVGQDAVGTTTDVHVLLNSVSRFDGAVTGFGPGSAVAFRVVMRVAQGDTIDFAVGTGGNGFFFDSTGLSGSIHLDLPTPIASTINQGAAQRSMIQGIGLVFDRDVSSLLQSSFLKARNVASGQVYDLSTATLLHDPSTLSATWMLDKNPAALLPDGNYIAWLETDQLVNADLMGKYALEGGTLDDFTFGFHQLAGDSDGDRDVDFKDACVLRAGWQKASSQAPYRTHLDFDLNDIIAETDRVRMTTTYFTVLAEQPALHAYLRIDSGLSPTDNRSSVYDVGVGVIGSAKFNTLEARLDARPYANVTAQRVSAGQYLLPQAIIDTLAGGSVSIGAHLLELRALNTTGAVVATEALSFENLGPTDYPPYFKSVPREGHALGLVPFEYTALAVDPEDLAVSYSIVANASGNPTPMGATINSSTGELSWLADAVGSAEFTLEARDPAGNAAQQRFIVNVLATDAPPTVQLQVYSDSPAINQLLTSKVTAQDDIGITERTLSVDGTPVTLNAQGFYTTTYTAAGIRDLLATATDTAGQTTTTHLQLIVRDPANPDPPGEGDDAGGSTGPVPIVSITSPASDSILTYLTQIRGTVNANGGTLHDWALEYALAENVNMQDLGGGTSWTRIASGTTEQSNAVLGTLDTTLLRNDSYVLRLLAYNTNGRGYVIPAIIHVAGNAKLGNFRLDFTDLHIPLAGIPITITRSYDTLEAARIGDFGYGWKLGIQDGDLRESTPGIGGLFAANPYRQGTRVYVTMPEGRRIGFTFQPEFASGSFFGSVYRAKFVPDPGVYEKLSVPQGEQGFLTIASDGSARLSFIGFGWNPDEFIVTRPDGTRFNYTQTEGLKTIDDATGNQLTFTRDGIRHSSGVAIQFIRDAQGRITEIRDPDGGVIRYAYNAAGNLISVTDRLTNATQFTYRSSPAHYLEDVIDPLGNRAQRTEYDASGRVAAVIDAQGHRIEQSFDPTSFTGNYTDARGNITTLVYDVRGNVTEQRNPEGGITRHEFADAANPDKETANIDALGHRTTFTYDAQGNTLSTTAASGLVTIETYSALNHITSITRKNSLGVVLSTESAEYDSTGHLTRITNCAGLTRDFVHDLQGRLIRSTDFEGHLTIYDYTSGCPCGRPGTITYADGTTKRFEYNHFSQITKTTDETGAITRNEYDAQGRKIREIDHDGHAVVIAYDAANNVVSRTDRLGHITKFVYDVSNHLTREIRLLTDDGNDTNDVITNYEYDGDDHRIALVDPVGNRTAYTFDRDGRLATRTDALGQISTVHYDLAGNTTEVIDRNGHKRSFLYNVNNQLTAERWHNTANVVIRTFTVGYDALGRRTSIADPDSAYTWQYDASSRITQESNAGTPLLPAVTFTLGYDRDSRLTSITDNAGIAVHTTFDVRGRSDHFTWSGGGISAASVNVDRNGRGQLTRLNRYADATLTSLVSQTTFDQIAPQGWVKQLQHRAANGSLYNAGSNFTYSYDAEGQLTGQTSQGNTTTYSFDPIGELTGANHSDAAYPDEAYTYDKAGNRLTSHLHASPSVTDFANRLQTDGEFNFTYDAEGNLTRRTDIASGNVLDLVYDHRDRVTSITARASVGGAITSTQSFIYDALDRRIGIIANGTANYVAFFGDNAWADYNAAGTATKRYLFADRIDGNLASWTPAGGTQWYLTDKLGSIRGLVTSGGALAASAGYDSFGSTKVSTGSLATERFGFAGRETLGFNLAYNRSRLLSTASGRWLSEDRTGFIAGDANLYRYVSNAPGTLVDPSGASALIEYAGELTFSFGPVGGAIGSMVGTGQGFGATNIIFIGALLGEVGNHFGDTYFTYAAAFAKTLNGLADVKTQVNNLGLAFNVVAFDPAKYWANAQKGIVDINSFSCDATSFLGAAGVPIPSPVCDFVGGFGAGLGLGEGVALGRLRALFGLP